MIIRSLKAKNFRNYDHLDLSFGSDTNIFYGKNAQGKTNILEALYVGGTTKSHRMAKDRDMILFSEEEAHLEIQVGKKKLSYTIDMHLKKNHAKGVAINKVPVHRASELFGIVNLIFFSPENLNMIKNAPSERRRFIDMELCQLDPIYVNQLASYNRALKQRNSLLKSLPDKNPDLEMLSLWDSQLASFGNKIISQRKIFVQNLNKIIYNIHKRLSGNLEELQIVYCPDVNGMTMQEALERNRRKDLFLRSTSVGPQRDDLSFKINGNDVKLYGSQGQQRTVSLSLKLAEIDLVKQIVHDKPVLLLDDVLSELDRDRQEYLLESIDDIQTMITCTGLDDFVRHRFTLDQVYEVIEGSVFDRTERRLSDGSGRI